MTPRRLRRTEMTTPATSEKVLRRAAASDADVVIVDLEDSVAEPAKDGGRDLMAAAMSWDWGAKSVAVRINGLGTGHLLRDVAAVLALPPDRRPAFVVMPKARGPEDVRWLGALLDEAESAGPPLDGREPIGIEVLIEKAQAVASAPAVAAAHRRVEALVLGPGDYLASLGSPAVLTGRVDAVPAETWAHARQSLLVAARAAGVDAVDAVYPSLRDEDGLRHEAARARACGFAGKWVIHPAQIAPVNEAFTPTAQEAGAAERLVAAAELAAATGTAAWQADGQMIDAAHLRIAAQIINSARRPPTARNGTERT